MPSIPVVNPLGYIGVFLVIAGFFLVIAGIELIKIEKLTITPGRKTWGIGLLLATIGVLFLLPDIRSATKSSPAPNSVDTIAPAMTLPATSANNTYAVEIPTIANTTAEIVHPTSVNNIAFVETPTLTPIALMHGAVTAASHPVACVTARTGSGIPVEVQADTLIFFGNDGLQLVSGEIIPFRTMRGFEVQEYGGGAKVTITLLSGDTIGDDVQFSFLYLSGIAKRGEFSIQLDDVKRVEFRAQGGCQ